MPTDEGSESEEEFPTEEEILEDIERAKATPLKLSKLKYHHHPRVIMAAVREEPRALENIIPRFLTDDMLKELITENGGYLEFIPPVLKTKELCLMALRKTDYILKSIPDKFKDVMFYEIAIDHNASNLAKVPDEMITPELIRRALEKNPNVIHVNGIKEKVLHHLPRFTRRT